MAKRFSTIDIFMAKRAFGAKPRLDFYRQTASFLRGGIPLADILRKLIENYRRANKSNPIIIVLSDLLNSMNTGQAFSDALARWAPPGEVMLVRAGERGGSLVEAFENAITTTEATQEMKSTLMKGLSYPILLLVVLAGLIYMFSTMIIPSLVEAQPPEKWPAMGQALYSMSHFVEHFWWTVVLAIAALSVICAKLMPTHVGRGREVLDKIPPFSFYKAFQSSVLLISISALMRTGVPLVDAVESLASRSKGYVMHQLRVILLRLRSGRQTGEAFDTGFLSRNAALNIRIYSELSTLHESMDTIGREAVADGVRQIKVAAAALNGLAICGIAIYVGWAYLAFFMITQSVGTSTGGF